MKMKKIGASLGMLAAASGLGAGVAASASAATPNAPHYDWYKVTGDLNSSSTTNALRKLTQATSNKSDPNFGVMATETNVYSGNSNKATATFYYRATSPFAGGSSVDNGYAYNAWKTAPNQLREIYQNQAASNPSKGLYTYKYFIMDRFKSDNFNKPIYKFYGEVVNGAHWAY